MPELTEDQAIQETAAATVHEEELGGTHYHVASDRHAVSLLPDEPGMTGYLARFNVVTDRGTFFVKSAFNKSLLERKTSPHLWQHWPDLIIGVNKDAEVDSKGLKIKAVLNESDELGARAMSMYRFGAEHGWVPGWSIGFDRVKDRTANEEEMARLDFTGAGPYKNAPYTELRAITEANIWEGSSVTWGAIHNAGPDVVHARSSVLSVDIATLSVAAREGRLTPEQLAQVSQLSNLIATQQTRAGAGATSHHSTPPVPSQDQHAAALDLLFFELGIIDGVAA